jgi:hypothetical protein
MKVEKGKNMNFRGKRGRKKRAKEYQRAPAVVG